ncbi:hypothetical protein [Aeromonas caviae]|uniref:hypothetical protein n=1 Tax=Aeromonas caviae TaxID=648 RepID=UPI00191F947B|nr:hypothetical protein [Aeromonas caviae]
MFRIYDISAFDKVNIEELGTKSKFWYTDESGGEFLFKSVVTYDRDGHEIKRYGEDWAEKVACELGKVRTSIPRTKNENFSHLISMGYQ